MSRREEALSVLVDRMKNAAEDRDRIAAADKILRSTNVSKAMQEDAIKVLEEIMNDWSAEDRDKINAADKLKDRTTPKAETALDIARQLAQMSDAELEEVSGKAMLA